LGARLLEKVRLPLGNDDPGVALAEMQGHTLADASARARDDDHLARDGVHLVRTGRHAAHTTALVRSPPMGLSGTVIVTGGGSGIGRATAQRAAREGARVAVFDRHADNAAETVALIGEAARAYPCDVGDESAVDAAVAAAAADLGQITGVVTAAGIFYGP